MTEQQITVSKNKRILSQSKISKSTAISNTFLYDDLDGNPKVRRFLTSHQLTQTDSNFLYSEIHDSSR